MKECKTAAVSFTGAIGGILFLVIVFSENFRRMFYIQGNPTV